MIRNPATEGWQDRVARISTAAELAAALRSLLTVCDLRYADLARLAKQLPPSGDRARTLPTSTICDLLRTGRPRREALVTFLTCCGVPSAEQAGWIEARVRIEGADGPPPRGAVRVADMDARTWGVHAAITAEGTAPDSMPAYVMRDFDLGPDGLRARLQRLAQLGGFLLLLGGSSVGKTRSVFEALRATLPGWWIVHPRDGAELQSLADRPRANFVVWLDELQDLLEVPDGLDADLARRLMTGKSPMVLVGTLWPDRYGLYSALPTYGADDPYAHHRQLLKLADVLVVDDAFTDAERERATELASDDPRLKLALESREYGVTQTLAGAPQLIRRWNAAADPYCRALMAATIDVSRLGARAPLAETLLRSLTPAYCTDPERAAAPADWFAHALHYTTAVLHGATSVLVPAVSHQSDSMGAADGYRLADFLLQHAGRARRTVIPPESAWSAYAAAVTSPTDLMNLGRSAENRALRRHAEILYRQASHLGSRSAAGHLSCLLSNQQRYDEAAELDTELESYSDVEAEEETEDFSDGVDIGEHSVSQIGGMWAIIPEDGRDVIDELRYRAEQGAGYVRPALALMLLEKGRLDEAEEVIREALQDPDEATRHMISPYLVDLRRRQGRLADATAVLQNEHRAAGWHDRVLLAEILEEQGRYPEAEETLRPAEDDESVNDDREAWSAFLERRGRLDEAEAVLRGTHSDWGFPSSELPAYLERHDRADDAHAARLAAALDQPCHWNDFFGIPSDDPRATRMETDLHKALNEGGSPRLWHALAQLYNDTGQPDKALTAARAAIAAGDANAGDLVGKILAARGEDDAAVNAWRAATASGHGASTASWAMHLIGRGQNEQGQRLSRYGLTADGSIAQCWWSAEPPSQSEPTVAELLDYRQHLR